MAAAYRSLDFTGTILETFVSKDLTAADRAAILKALRLLDEDERCGRAVSPPKRWWPPVGPSRPLWGPAISPGYRATPAGLRADLALARDEIRRLRAETDKLRTRLRLQEDELTAVRESLRRVMRTENRGR